MAFDGPAAGIGGALLNRFNLSDDEVVKDFAFELRRCLTNEDYAVWAKRWGEVAAAQLMDPGLADHSACADKDDLNQAEYALAEAEDRASAMERAIGDAVSALADIAASLSGGPQDEVHRVAGKLEDAL